MLAATTKHVRACLRKNDGALVLTRSFGMRDNTTIGTDEFLWYVCSHRVSMVLKEDVNKLGYRGDEVNVKAGFARNFLYPQKLAVYATPENRIKYKVDRESQDEAEVEKERGLKQVISRLEDATVYFKRHTASKAEQTLHTSVTAQEISEMLDKQYGIIVGVARIDLPTPIKTLGTHTVKVRVDDEVAKEVAAAEAAEGDVVEPVDVSKKQFVKVSVQVIRR